MGGGNWYLDRLNYGSSIFRPLAVLELMPNTSVAQPIMRSRASEFISPVGFDYLSNRCNGQM
jgi:hypothetical protein